MATEIRKTGTEMISAERERQLSSENWTLKHDDEHENGEIAMAAACYAAPVPIKAKMEVSCGCREALCAHSAFPPTKWMDPWPWEASADKRKKHDRLRQLVIAGALIAAEIDRLNRISDAPAQSYEARPGVEGAHEGTTADEEVEFWNRINEEPLESLDGSREPEKLNSAQKWPPTITLSHGAPPAGSSPIGALAESSLSSPPPNSDSSAPTIPESTGLSGEPTEGRTETEGRACICAGNWREIVQREEGRIGQRFERHDKQWHLFGIVHGDDDYYYGMSAGGELLLVSCVSSIEGSGFRQIETEKEK